MSQQQVRAAGFMNPRGVGVLIATPAFGRALAPAMPSGRSVGFENLQHTHRPAVDARDRDCLPLFNGPTDSMGEAVGAARHLLAPGSCPNPQGASSSPGWLVAFAKHIEQVSLVPLALFVGPVVLSSLAITSASPFSVYLRYSLRERARPTPVGSIAREGR